MSIRTLGIKGDPGVGFIIGISVGVEVRICAMIEVVSVCQRQVDRVYSMWRETEDHEKIRLTLKLSIKAKKYSIIKQGKQKIYTKFTMKDTTLI